MTRRHFLLGLLAASCVGPVRAAEPPGAQWITVVAPAFRTAIQPLCEQRKTEGMRVVVVETTALLTPKEILAGESKKLRDKVNALCREFRGTSYVLLVGAVESAKVPDAKKVVPPLVGTAGRMKGQPTDNGYGCPGDGLLPSVAVGRFPARTEAEARQMVKKTVAFERDAEPGEWRGRLTILAGVPAFDPLVDKLVEGLAMARLARLHPRWSGRAIYHNEQSRFCVPDDRLHAKAMEYLQEGQVFTLYLGHSGPSGFYAGTARFLDREDWAKVKIARGPGIFATFGCNGCQLAGSAGEGYGVAAIRNPNGPVAVLGSHGICFAAMVQLAATGLFESSFAGKPPERLGMAWLAIKAGLAHGKIDALTFKLLDAVDGDSDIPQATQRQEHLEMFLLLGDPALRFPALPDDVKLTVGGEASPGKTITIQGKLPERLAEGHVRLTLARPVDSEPADLQPLPQKPPDARARVMLANHERSNQFVLASKELTAKGSKFEASLEMPPKLPWSRVIIRAYAFNQRGEAMAALPLAVKKQPVPARQPASAR